MELTPVRIRGKRYRPGQKPSNSSLKPVRKAVTKRPNPSPAHDHSSSSKTKSAVAIRLDNWPEPRLSPLESLPVELLEQIFWHSPNIHLPAASVPLCTKLFSIPLRRELFRKVCLLSTTPCTGLLHANAVTHLHELQSALLRLKWVTWPFIREVVHITFPETIGPSLQGTEPFSLQSDTLPLSLDDGTYVPSKLLHGPWTHEKLAFLDHLLWSCAKIDTVNSTDGELAEAGFMEAIRAGDVEALQVLRVREVLNTAKDFWTIDQKGIVPRTEHLRTAITQRECNEDVVEILLLASPTQIDLHDPHVWNWIHDKKIKGDEGGSWLEQKLKEAVVFAEKAPPKSQWQRSR